MRARAPIGVLRQVLKASLGRGDRRIHFVGVANGTRASTSCVAGLTTSRHSVRFDSTNSPSMSSLTVGTGWLWVMGLAAIEELLVVGKSMPLLPAAGRGRERMR